MRFGSRVEQSWPKGGPKLLQMDKRMFEGMMMVVVEGVVLVVGRWKSKLLAGGCWLKSAHVTWRPIVVCTCDYHWLRRAHTSIL